MNIKFQALAPSLRQKTHALYILTGQDHYLLNESARMIKEAWRKRAESDEHTIHLNTPADWTLLQNHANSYSLFAELVLLDARFDKKSLDAHAKHTWQNYVQNINSRCLIILRAPNVPSKQLQLLANNDHTMLVQASPFTPAALQSWIVTQLQNASLRHAAQVPFLIYQYTKGNMLACAQVIEKLILTHHEHSVVTEDMVAAQLSDQCEYQLYELAEACLTTQAGKATHLLRQACQNRTEPTLILWLLSQEIRQLIQFSHLRSQSVSLTSACSQLKIWPARAQSYEATRIRLPLARLYYLLQLSQQLDELIKSNQSATIWHGLEHLALALC